jgi:hypothetical protein
MGKHFGPESCDLAGTMPGWFYFDFRLAGVAAKSDQV